MTAATAAAFDDGSDSGESMPGRPAHPRTTYPAPPTPHRLTLLDGVVVGRDGVQHDQVPLVRQRQLPLARGVHACRQAVKLPQHLLVAVPHLQCGSVAAAHATHATTKWVVAQPQCSRHSSSQGAWPFLPHATAHTLAAGTGTTADMVRGAACMWLMVGL
jgi:hypothetical protein